MIAADPGQGGAAWAVLQYVLGLQTLGHEVFLVEPVLAKAIRPAGARLQDSENARYFQEIVTDFGLQGRAALLVPDTRDIFGIAFSELDRAARRADVHFNIAGMLAHEPITAKVPIRVYLDLDPAFTQLWHAVQGIDMRFAGHTHYVTIGLNIGRPGCSVPTCDLPWIHTVQPVVLVHWPASPTITRHAFTTIGNWRGYGSIEHHGILYGQKAHSLRDFYPLPTLTDEAFCLAMAIHPQETKDLAALAANGWQLLDPHCLVASPRSYQRFIQESKGEFGIAKSGYVKSQCGWFSDRSIAYLASGKPVIAQDTGFRGHIPTAHGLLPFDTLPDILNALDTLRRDYPRHATAARDLAEDCFDSNKVLTRLMEAIGA